MNLFGLNMPNLGQDLLNLGKDIWAQDKAEGMQDHAQHFAAGQQESAQNFNSAQAIAQRDWSEKMSSTQYQRATADMKAAGLNPMLAYHQGGASTTPGASATSSPAGAPGGHPVRPIPAVALQTAAQIRATDALTEKTRAEENEIKARTPTHSVSIERMRQEITESKERIEKLMAEVNAIMQGERTSAAQQFHLQQQTRNLQEEIPKIRNTVDLLRSQLFESAAKTGLADEQTKEIQNKVRANLPGLEAALKQLELHVRTPEASRDAAWYKNYASYISKFLREFNPISAIFAR